MGKINPEYLIAENRLSPIWNSSFEAGAGDSGLLIDHSPDLGGLLVYSSSDTYNPEDGTGTVRVRLHEAGIKFYSDASSAATSSVQFIHETGGVVGTIFGNYNAGTLTQSLTIQSDDTVAVGNVSQVTLTTADTSTRSTLRLATNRNTNNQTLKVYADSGTFTGFNVGGSGTPDVMLDVQGAVKIDGDLTWRSVGYNMVIGTGALATTATNGFVYISSSNGVPTGNPTDYTGRLPITIDSAANDLYLSDGTNWYLVGGGGSGSGAPKDAQYVTLATNATLTAERVLTGTSNQITVTDNGAGSTVVLSTPQNLHTSATPQFSRLGLNITAPGAYRFEALLTGTGIQNTASLTNQQAAAADVGARLLFTGTSDTAIAGIGGAWTAGATTNGYLTLYTRQSNVFTEAMRITATNLVGIATNAPKSKLHIEGASGWIVQDEQDTDVTTTELDSLDSIAIYNKSNKFVIAYNNGGTITYITIPLDGSTTTWTHNTTAP